MDLYNKHGFLYLMLPERFGGLDGDITSLCIVIEELAKVSGTSSLIPLAHNVGVMPFMVAANDEQKEYIYGKLADPIYRSWLPSPSPSRTRVRRVTHED